MSAHPLSAANRTVFGTVVVYMDRDSDGQLDLPSYRHPSPYGDPLGPADAILGMRNDMMIFYNEGPLVQMHVGELVSPELPSGFGMVSTPFLNARKECKYQHADDMGAYEDCVRGSGEGGCVRAVGSAGSGLSPPPCRRACRAGPLARRARGMQRRT